MRQLFGNVIDNAIKFTDHGEVRVRLTADDGEVIGQVIDSGSGIDEESIDRVRPFLPHRQIPNPRR